MISKKTAFFLLFVVIAIVTVFADNKRDIPQQLTQPNGEILNCFASGDEFYNWLHDANGFTIIQNPHTGYWVYASLEGSHLVATSLIAGKSDPAKAGLAPNIHIPADKINEIIFNKRKKLEQNLQKNGVRAGTNKGNFNNIVVFIKFQDQTDFITPFSTVSAKFNDSTTNSTSMYNYYKATSYNTLFMRASFFPIPNGNIILSYQDIYPRNYYLPYNAQTNPDGYQGAAATARETGLLIRAINYIQSQVPANLNIDYDLDGNVDNIIFVIRGQSAGWSDLLWSHRTSLWAGEAYILNKRVWDYNFVMEDDGLSVSTLCHEMFHTLGAPDLYHNPTEPAAAGLDPVNSWDLMCYNSNPPQHSGSFMKMKYGKWIDNIPQITTAGTYSIKPLGSATNENICYRIASEIPSIYYVLDYRYKGIYFESGVPGSGLTITRINTDCNPIAPCSGNMSYNDLSTWDEVYVFRPGGNPYEVYGFPRLTNGNPNMANFSNLVNRTVFNNTTDPYPFNPVYNGNGTWSYLSGSLDITNITEYSGDSIVFTYNTPNYINVSEDHISLPNATQTTYPVYVNSNTTFYISSSLSGNWYHLNKNAGFGTDTVIITVTSYNTTEETRYDTLTIFGAGASAKKIYLQQSGFYLFISEDTVGIPAVGGSKTITINSSSLWTMLPNMYEWISFSPDQGIGETELTISAVEIPSSVQRNCELVILSATHMFIIEVVQSAYYAVNSIDKSIIDIFPNPTSNFVNLRNNNPAVHIDKVEIYDIYGKLMQVIHISDNVTAIDLSNYKPGFYVIKIYSNNEAVKVHKIVKN